MHPHLRPNRPTGNYMLWLTDQANLFHRKKMGQLPQAAHLCRLLSRQVATRVVGMLRPIDPIPPRGCIYIKDLVTPSNKAQQEKLDRRNLRIITCGHTNLVVGLPRNAVGLLILEAYPYPQANLQHFSWKQGMRLAVAVVDCREHPQKYTSTYITFM